MEREALLLRRMRQGEEEAIETFVRAHYPAILRYCRCHLRDSQEAEDMTQETFARFFANLDQYKHYGKAANYLYVVAGNLCRDQARKSIPLPMEDLPEPTAPPQADLDARADLEAAFRALPPDLRSAAVLFFLEERRQREIAKILGIGLPLVKYRIRKARTLLAAYLRREVPQ